MKHHLSVPENAGPHALLCFLHGYDEAAPLPLDAALTRHGPLREGNPAVVKERFIVLAPQLPLAGDIWHRYADDVQALVAATIERLGGDRHRAYLTGFSFGANGVFDLALLQPGLWAALWAVDPTRVPKRAIAQPIWLSIGEVARWQKKAFIEALVLQDASRHRHGRRLCADHGDDHVGAARRAYADPQIYEWLLRFRARA